MTKARHDDEPWDHPAPRGTRSQPLSPAAKASAKRRARAAGRPYPNLVDNMHAAQHQKAKQAGTRKQLGTPKQAGARKRAKAGATAKTQDPKGGLTSSGRAAFERRDGAHLKPGVTKRIRDMTPEEMRRKGSWATRFYGRAQLPPLRDAEGRPTRFALSAHAWGEPVPRTEAAARRIADKGRRLLARYRRMQNNE